MAIPRRHSEPIVCLKRLSKSELEDIGYPMPATEVQRSGDEDDNDDLPSSLYASVGVVQNDKEAEMKARGDAILRLYEEKIRDAKNMEKMRAVEADLAKMALEMASAEDDDGAAVAMSAGCSAVLTENNLSLTFAASDSSFPDVHPGLHIFSYRAKYFTPDMVNFSHLKNPANAFERVLKCATYDDLLDLISMSTFHLKFSTITDKGAAVRFLIRFLSVGKRADATWPCLSLICELFRANHDLARFVTPELIIEVLLNYGTTVEKLLPQELVESVSQRLASSKESLARGQVDLQEVEPFSAVAVGSCLSSLCKVITLAFDEWHVTWNADDVYALAIMLVTATLDKRLTMSTHVFDVQLCIDRLLNLFTEEEWSLRIGPYVEALCRICEHHHNMTYLMWSLPLSSRGRHLQHVAASMMLQKLLRDDSPLAAVRLSPSRILNLAESQELHRSEDFYLMYSILHLIDFAIGADLPISRVRSTASLSSYLCQVQSRIRDKNSGASGWKVKDLLTQMRNKWASMANNVPMVQRTLFSFMNTCTKEQSDSQNSEISMSESQD